MLLSFQLRNLKRSVERHVRSVREDESAAYFNYRSESVEDDHAEKKYSDEESDADVPNAAVCGRHPAYTSIPGIEACKAHDGTTYYKVSWTGPEDANNPKNWTTVRRLKTTALLFSIAFVVTAASSSDSAVLKPAAEDFGVSDVTETLGGTAMYLIGFGLGALLCSPLPELVGRYPVYLGTLIIFGIWLMASALSPNIGAQIAFRFLAGLFGSAPLTVAGGTMSDIWNPKEKTWAFPLFAISGFGGPTLGPVISSYFGYTGVLSWRWAEWIMLIIDGLVILLVVAFKEETLGPQLLKYKAHYFRKLTGDKRFMTEAEAAQESTWTVLKSSFSRPFILALEPIILAWTLYLTVIYIVLFTYLDGYTFIYSETYGIGPGLTNIIFTGLFVGILMDLVLVPIVYRKTKRHLARDGDEGQGTKINRESRLLFAMYGAPTIPIGLFWQAWTDFPSVSIWAPIVASAVVGFGIISIFLSAYMYIIDSYEIYAASALTFVALVRYLAAGGMTVVGVPMYKNLGPRYTLTILACISVAVLPIPYALYKWGPKIRARSKYAVKPEN